MAQNATRSALMTEQPAEESETRVPHSDIAALAFQLWKERGCPDGSPEDDWYKAEQRLKTETTI
jgi:hypothetical protein